MSGFIKTLFRAQHVLTINNYYIPDDIIAEMMPIFAWYCLPLPNLGAAASNTRSLVGYFHANTLDFDSYLPSDSYLSCCSIIPPKKLLEIALVRPGMYWHVKQ